MEESKITLGDYVRLWLDEVAKKKVRTRTFQSYSHHLNRHVINSSLSNKRLTNLKTTHVQKIYNKMEASGLSPRSIHYLHTILKASLAYAVDADYIAKNPCKNPRIILPPKKEKEIIVLDQQEVSRFIAECQNFP